MFRPVRYTAAVLMLVLVTTGLLVGAQGSQAQGQANRLVWAVVPGVSSATDIQDVVMLDQNNAWAVGLEGDAGRAYKFELRGGLWTVAASEAFTSPLRAVAPISDSNVWAVGGNNDGRIMHKDASGWHVMSNPVPQSSLFTIQMFGNGEEGWAGGYSNIDPRYGTVPLLLHYKAGRWTQDMSINDPNSGGLITSIHFVGKTGWAVGPGAWRFKDGIWSKLSSCGSGDPNTYCHGALYGVRTISDNEAWFVGISSGPCGHCGAQPRADHWQNGATEYVIPEVTPVGSPQKMHFYSDLETVAFSDSNHGVAVGSYHVHEQFMVDDVQPLLLTYDTGTWYYINPPVPGGDLNGVNMADATHILVVGNDGLLLSYGYGPQGGAFNTPGPEPTMTAIPSPTPKATATPSVYPTTRVSDPHDPAVTYFDLVGHTLRGAFKAYWHAQGGLPQFGYPLTEEYTETNPSDGKMYGVQYFERARFEYHPENKAPYDVLLGLLGNTVTQSRNDAPFWSATPIPGAGNLFFSLTRHNMAPEFAAYWQSHGGLPVYGYPISEPFQQMRTSDGKVYTVQYFERNRLEFQSDLPPAYRVILGRLGSEILHERGWLH